VPEGEVGARIEDALLRPAQIRPPRSVASARRCSTTQRASGRAPRAVGVPKERGRSQVSESVAVSLLLMTEPNQSGRAPVHSGQPTSLRELGYDEIWLQNWLAADPTRLGLGEVTIRAQELTSPRGGSLDILAPPPTAIRTTRSKSSWAKSMPLTVSGSSTTGPLIARASQERRTSQSLWPRAQPVAWAGARSARRVRPAARHRTAGLARCRGGDRRSRGGHRQ
jgi:hypothetical protein